MWSGAEIHYIAPMILWREIGTLARCEARRGGVVVRVVAFCRVNIMVTRRRTRNCMLTNATLPTEPCLSDRSTRHRNLQSTLTTFSRITTQRDVLLRFNSKKLFVCFKPPKNVGFDVINFISLDNIQCWIWTSVINSWRRLLFFDIDVDHHHAGFRECGLSRIVYHSITHVSR